MKRKRDTVAPTTTKALGKARKRAVAKERRLGRKRLVQPMPEVVAPGTKWTVEHVRQGGHAARGAGLMGAPLFDTLFARAVRLHELLHIGFSPEKPDPKRHGVGAATLLAVEDARVNEIGCRKGLGDILAELYDPTVPPPDPRDDLRRATLLLVATHGTGDFVRVVAAFRERGTAGALACNLAKRAILRFTGPTGHPDFAVTVEVAKMLDRALGPGDPDEFPMTLEVPMAAGEGTAPGRGPGRRVRGTPPWGELRRVEEPPRPLACRRGASLPDLRLSDEGVLLVRPERLLTDGMAFGRRRRVPGGTVLIDASGSMNLDVADVLEIIDAAPGATVACYDGSSAGWGVIRVLVRDRRRVPDRLVTGPSGHSGNVIDGPALRWLAEQPGPRVWVSDGCVTGIGDRHAPGLHKEVGQICRSAGIVRVDDAAAARKVLRAGRRPLAA